MNTRYETRIKAIESYANGTKSFRRIAQDYRISPTTLGRWLKWHKEGGDENLKREDIFKPWNRWDEDAERKIAFLKEKNPSLTITKAQNILFNQGSKISAKGIWSIWKRYGLASVRVQPGADERSQLFPLPKGFMTPLVKEAYDLLQNFASISPPELLKRARVLRKKLERKQLFYSAIRIGLAEVIALSWMAKPLEQLSLLHHLKKRMPKKDDPQLKFQILTAEGMAYARMLEIGKAKN